jgi:hypothetical protein
MRTPLVRSPFAATHHDEMNTVEARVRDWRPMPMFAASFTKAPTLATPVAEMRCSTEHVSNRSTFRIASGTSVRAFD